MVSDLGGAGYGGLKIFCVGVNDKGFVSGGQTLIALMIGQKFRTRRLALHTFPMRRATAVRNRPDQARRRLFRLGRDRVEFERCCLTRRRGGAEKHAENIFSRLASELARLRRKVKTCERGDSGDHTAGG